MNGSDNDTDDKLRHNKADRRMQMVKQMHPKSEKSVEPCWMTLNDHYDSVNEVIWFTGKMEIVPESAN